MTTAIKLSSRLAPWLGGMGRGRDFALTFVTEFVTLSSTLLVFKLAAMWWGTTGFGEYVLARRMLGVLQLPILCGMGVAVTRYVARSRAAGDPQAAARFFGAGVLVAAAAAAFAVLVLNVAPGLCAMMLFGGEAYRPLVRALSPAVAGIAFHGVAYGYFRGRLEMIQANLLQGINLGLAPLLAISWPGLDVAQVVGLTGILWCGISGAVILRELARAPHSSYSLSAMAGTARILISYGGPRVPGEFALGALFALPVRLAAHYMGLTAAGFVGLSVSVLTMIGSLFAPLGHIVLPAVSARAVGPGQDGLRVDSWRLVGLCLGLAGVLAVTLELVAGPLVRAVFGSHFAPAVPVIRVIAVAIVPYVAYIVLRNFLDALQARPLNAKNLVITLIVFLVLCLLTGRLGGVPIAFTASLTVLGALSWRDAHRALSMRDPG